MPKPDYTMTEAEEAIATQVTLSPVTDGTANLIPGNPGPRKPQLHQLDAALESILDPFRLAESLLKLVKAGNLAAIRYAYDRLAGLPVQRHEAKLLAEVDDTARRLAEAYGMSVDEVRAQARKLAQGT